MKILLLFCLAVLVIARAIRFRVLSSRPVLAACQECGTEVLVATSAAQADTYIGQVRPYACGGCGTAFFVDFSGGYVDRMTGALAEQEQVDFDIGVQNRHGGFAYPRKDVPDA